MARWLIHDKSLLKMVISQSTLFEYQRAISRHLPTRSIMLFWGAPKSALFWYPSRVPNFIRHGLHKPSQIGALLLGYHNDSQSHRGRFPQLYKFMAFPLNIGTFPSTEEISNCLASGICRWHGTQEFSVFFFRLRIFTRLIRVVFLVESQIWQMGMDQYLLIPFLGGWTSIYQLFWCSPGVQGFDTLPNKFFLRFQHFCVLISMPHLGFRWLSGCGCVLV